MTAISLAGIILYSPEPENLAKFYKEVIGIPFELQSHGKIKEHFECLFGNIHFAILKRKEATVVNSIVPSFRVDNLKQFIETKGLKTLHQFIDLGEGKMVTSISDVDGNMIRLIQLS